MIPAPPISSPADAGEPGGADEEAGVEDREDKTIYDVVVNDEEQYSIWPSHKEIPAGWKKEGTSGLKAECLAHIEKVWTDMRPRSLRERMEQDAAQQG